MYAHLIALYKWQKAIENILKKDFYYTLENVKILFKGDIDTVIDWLVSTLKLYQKILKYQFKKLNIGICKIIANVQNNKTSKKMYNVLEWNPNVDDKVLDDFKCLCTNDEQQNGAKEKYLSLLRVY